MSQTSGRDASRRWVTWLLTAAAVLVVLLALLVVMLPTLLSSGAGKRLILNAIDRQIAGSVDIEALRLRWLSGQSAEGVSLRDPEGGAVLFVNRVEASQLGLWSTVRGSQRYGPIRVEGRDLSLRQRPGEPTNLQRALAQAQPVEDEPADPMGVNEDLATHIEITFENISYETPDLGRVDIDDFAAELNVSSPQRLGLTVLGDLRHEDAAGRIDVDIDVADAFDAQGQPQFDAARLEARGSLAELPIEAIDRIAGQEGRLVALLGPRLTVELDAAGPLDSLSGRLSANSEVLEAEIGLEGEAEELRAVAGSHVSYRMTPRAYAILMEAEGEDAPATLLEAFDMEVSVERLALPRTEAGLELADASLDVSGSMSPIRLMLADRGELALRETRFGAEAERLGERMTAELTARALFEDVDEAFRLSVEGEHLLDEAGPLAVAMSADGLPVLLADALADQQGRLVATLGQRLDADVRLGRENQGDFTYAGSVSSPMLSGPFEGAYRADGRVQLRTPEAMSFRLTPEAFELWAGFESGEGMALEEPSDLRLNVEALDLAFLDGEAGAAPLGLDAARSQAVLALEIEAMRLRDRARPGTFRLNQGRIAIESEDLSLIELNIEAAIEDLTERLRREAEPREPGQVRSHTQLADFLDAGGQPEFAAARIQSESTLERVPSGFFDVLGGTDGQARAVLGDWASGRLALSFQPDSGGQAELDLTAEHASGRVPVAISPQWEARVSEPATAELAVTPELSELVLTRVNPFLTAVGGEEPIQLELAEGFALPLQDFSIQRVRGEADILLGTMRMEQGRLLQGIFGAFQVLGGRVGGARLFDAQFTPLHLSMADGLVRYEDFAMVAEGVRLNFAGLVNLNDERFDLVVGIPGESLRRISGDALDLEGVVGPGYELRVPLTGPFDEPELDTAAMGRELTQLAIQAGVRRGLGGGREREDGRGDPGRDLLEGILRGPQRQRDPEPEEEAEPEEEEQREERRRPSIFDLLP